MSGSHGTSKITLDEVHKGGKRWFPLESNPEVMNKYVAEMGWPTEKYRFTDVYSLDEDTLAMVPQPVLGVLMLFPIKEASEKHKAEEDKLMRQSKETPSDKVYFMKQTVGNACGTVGLLHCTLNASISRGIQLDKECFLHQFLEKTRELTPTGIAEVLHDDSELEKVHQEAAREGQSDQVADDVAVNTHFVCLSGVDGILYELDGRRDTPMPHGPTSTGTLLKDACKVVRAFMARDPDEFRFTIIALAPADGS